MVASFSADYAGDITASDAWERLKADTKTQLIDVRTIAEWSFVGLPDLAPLGARVHTIEWQTFPGGIPNGEFVAQTTSAIAAAGGDRSTPLLLLCRSGARSRSAAIALTGAGFAACFNVAGGFEGDVDAEGHRGTVNGWKASGLPWRQG